MKQAILISFIFISLTAKCIASPVADPDPGATAPRWFPIPIPSKPASSPGIVVQGANGGVHFGGSIIPAPLPTIIAPIPSNVVVTPGDALGNGGTITITG